MGRDNAFGGTGAQCAVAADSRSCLIWSVQGTAADRSIPNRRIRLPLLHHTQLTPNEFVVRIDCNRVQARSFYLISTGALFKIFSDYFSLPACPFRAAGSSDAFQGWPIILLPAWTEKAFRRESGPSRLFIRHIPARRRRIGARKSSLGVRAWTAGRRPRTPSRCRNRASCSQYTRRFALAVGAVLRYR